MMACDICGHINPTERLTCEECGSDLSDSPAWDDNLNFDEVDELGYADSDFYD